jgi:hypothetical protein
LLQSGCQVSETNVELFCMKYPALFGPTDF